MKKKFAWPGWASVFLIAAAGLVAYSGSFQGVFLLDDCWNVTGNPSIHALWPPWKPFMAEAGKTGMAGRPVANFTFAVNYAVSGLNVWSFHALNLLIHITAACLLFGIVSRTLSQGGLAKKYGGARKAAALACGLVFVLHPLNTQAVTYITQRCESLMGMFCFAVFYLAIRGWQAKRPWPWHLGAALAFVLGAGCKEVIASAPFLVLLYDVVFLRKKLLRALASSKVLYGGLAVGLLFQAMLILSGGTMAAASHPADMPLVAYLSAQPKVIFHYLRLAFWPSVLCFDYYGYHIPQSSEAIAIALALFVLVAATAWALWRRKPAGFLGAWFFVFLAPSSSFWPLFHVAEEYRMYVPLAAVIVLAVFTLYAMGLWAARHVAWMRGAWLGTLALLVLVAASAAMGTATFLRNRDYHSAEKIWADTVRKRPDNPFAIRNLADVYFEQGWFRQAIPLYLKSLSIKQNQHQVHYNLGVALFRLGKLKEAALCFKNALALKPDDPDAWYNLGMTLLELGGNREAVFALKHAQRLQPEAQDVAEALKAARAAMNLKAGS